MKIELPFVGGAYTARSPNLNAQVCQNFYLETDQTGAKSIIALVGTPGTTLWKDMGVAAEMRALRVFNDFLYAVLGNTLYRIDGTGGVTTIGTILTSTGWLDITSDETYLCLFEETAGWTWDGVTFARITDAQFPLPSGATYQDGYHIMSRTGTNEFYISGFDGALNPDPTSWSATDFANAEGAPDILVSPISVQRALWLIGAETTEIWYNSGATFPFDRNPGGFVQVGCAAKRSIATYQGELMFLSDKNQVVRARGFNLVPVSTYQIDYLISTMTTIVNAVGFIYTQEGHVFYELTFPTDSKTICYDLTTGFWHTRASGASDIRSPANCTAWFNNTVLVGHYDNGKIYEYDLAAYDDEGTVKRAIRAAQPLKSGNERTFFGVLELDMETGVGTVATPDPQIALQTSKDGGHTWSAERWKSMGAIGEYKTRVRWNRLGAGRNFVPRIIISDPVKRCIFNAYLSGINGGGQNDQS